MWRRRSGVLALAVTAALSCTGCVKAGGFRTGEDAARHQARQLALEDAEQVAEEVERRQFPQGGGDPGTARVPPSMDQRRHVERIASEFDAPKPAPPIASSSSRSCPGNAGSASSARCRAGG